MPATRSQSGRPRTRGGTVIVTVMTVASEGPIERFGAFSFAIIGRIARPEPPVQLPCWAHPERRWRRSRETRLRNHTTHEAAAPQQPLEVAGHPSSGGTRSLSSSRRFTSRDRVGDPAMVPTRAGGVIPLPRRRSSASQPGGRFPWRRSSGRLRAVPAALVAVEDPTALLARTVDLAGRSSSDSSAG
jgi:hypothetical protein